MVGMTGFEPAAPASRTQCSTSLSYIPRLKKEAKKFITLLSGKSKCFFEKKYWNKNMPPQNLSQPTFLPTTQKEMTAIGWPELDILLVQGDAYLDHPAQGPALLGRWLVAHGFRVGLISQPRWQDGPEDFLVMGRPRLFLAISAGAMDSMLAHYTAFRKKRSTDSLTPGGRCGARPNRASLVYTSLARAAFPGLPVFIGGLEASLRRLSHYDFWQDKLRRSFLLEAKADLLIYGPGEIPLLTIAKRLAAGNSDLNGIGGTAVALNAQDDFGSALELPSHEAILEDRRLLLASAYAAEEQVHHKNHATYQISAGRAVLINPPAPSLTGEELDFIYGLPFTRKAHPSYKEPIPAAQMLTTSLTTHRGCGGACAFCSLALHQGRHIISRSQDSIISEAQKLAKTKPIALSDVGAATANFWGASCRRSGRKCLRQSCLWPQICPHLQANQKPWVGLLSTLAALPEVKQVRVASGVRYDLFLEDESSLAIFLQNFVGGQLKVAPEHFDSGVLDLMRKPPWQMFEKFLTLFKKLSPPKHYLIPYLISAYPGSSAQKMATLKKWFGDRSWQPQQVQCFIPTPGTVATAMYFAATGPDGKPLNVAHSDAERLRQHSYLNPSHEVSTRPSFTKGAPKQTDRHAKFLTKR